MDRTVSSYCDVLQRIEDEYLFDISEPDGYKLAPQEARGILPLDLKSELVMTGFVSDWIHFFRLRSYLADTGKPHPDIQVLTDSLMNEFIIQGYCTLEDIEDAKIKTNN
jgi:thymidylate synthase ThyX